MLIKDERRPGRSSATPYLGGRALLCICVMARANDPHAGDTTVWRVTWINHKKNPPATSYREVRTEHFLRPFVEQLGGNGPWRPRFRLGEFTETKYVVFYDLAQSRNAQRNQRGPPGCRHKWSAASTHKPGGKVVIKKKRQNVWIKSDDVDPAVVGRSEWFNIIKNNFHLSQEVPGLHPEGGTKAERLRTQNGPVVTPAQPQRRQRIGRRELRSLGIETSQGGSSRVTRSRARATSRRTRQSTLGRSSAAAR